MIYLGTYSKKEDMKILFFEIELTLPKIKICAVRKVGMLLVLVEKGDKTRQGAWKV